ncbi:85/88 kDa calcium-independent phospholipase A2 [Camellia lanceoleosa]|uniref:85/88 kDa calcium-independent phospholipase A2 n=1 Tax=Camellia lanceoleosa TaxID=1840588 RepID=A0ACC0GNV1_9ERIC|nr:85/88 kDa calcium-independent phospholipase A2 [Camellia lanceoleosa]
MPVLLRAATFQAFVITNTIAMICSISTGFLYASASFYNEVKKPELRHLIAFWLILVARGAMVVAFITGTFTVLSHSLGIAITTTREGHSTIVRALIEYTNALDEELENRVGTTKDMMRMSNEAKDTALHEAVRNHHTITVQLLTQEGPEFCHPANNTEETPLYLAAKRGYVGLVFVILETCTVPAYGGPGGTIVLHSAVIHNLEGCRWKLLQWKPTLSKEADAYRWTPLH